ncbi:GNAT family N-acetyltransferase [Photorhabdus australis]
MVELLTEYIAAGYIYIAEQTGVILGFSVVLPQSDGNSELDGLFIEPAFWHQGIGKQLVRTALNNVHTKGGTLLRVLSNPQAKGFYIALGFERLGKNILNWGRQFV